MVFSARVVNADEAMVMALGLVHVAARDDVLKEAIDWAARFHHAPLDVIGVAKGVMNRTFETDRRTVYGLEATAQVLAGESNFHNEAVRRFMDKQPPLYSWPE